MCSVIAVYVLGLWVLRIEYGIVLDTPFVSHLTDLSYFSLEVHIQDSVEPFSKST